jgi:NAD(P)-dependent dehydrogenase (short-subunit alcohol dehydrogenase family)
MPLTANSTERSVVVTGGGYGIGRAAAIKLAASGWRVLVADIDAARASETARLIEQAGGCARAATGDVRDPAFAARSVEAAKTLAPLKGLVTCAAARCEGSITATTAEQWDRTVQIVLYGVFHFCRAVVPELVASGGGAIVNVSSPDAYGRKGMVAYAAAKAAVNTLSLCLAADHLADHVRVNVVLPSFTVTGMTEHYPTERLVDIAARSVAGRVATPRDVAHMIDFLMSDKAETITGSIMGGLPLATR